MTNLHYIADEQVGGVEREYAEIEREPVFGDLVIYDGKVREVTYVGLTAVSLDARIHVDISAMLTLDPTGNVRIDGTVYRMVDRKAAVGEKVLVTGHHVTEANGVFTAEEVVHDGHVYFGRYGRKSYGYRVLEPIDQAPADDLTLTEADVRNKPRQVIDLIANMAGRLSKLERRQDAAKELFGVINDRIDRLGTANQQAYDILARNVETWAQEIETIKARMGDAGRALTAEERREL